MKESNPSERKYIGHLRDSKILQSHKIEAAALAFVYEGTKSSMIASIFFATEGSLEYFSRRNAVRDTVNRGMMNIVLYSE